MTNIYRAVLLAALLPVAIITPPRPLMAASLLEVHYAPVENLETIDVDLINTAEFSIDMAAFCLTDRPIIAALLAAQARGVEVRIVLDPTQRHNWLDLQALGQSIRIKHKGPFMHLKSYVVDGQTTRTGSANFTIAGLKRQDNDLMISVDDEMALNFETAFNRVWEFHTAASPEVMAAQATEVRVQ